jgi:small nuclear ribonucleoprotein G
MPDLKSYMDKKVQVKLKGGRCVAGELRGVDTFMNLVLQNATDESRRPGQESATSIPLGETVIRGNVVVEIVGLV